MAEVLVEPLAGRGQAPPLRKRVASFPLVGAGLAPALRAISSPLPVSFPAVIAESELAQSPCSFIQA